MPSALIRSRPGYPAVPRAGQPAHQRSVLPNPLVLGETLRKFPTPTADRDRPVSRRSEPSSRTAFIGEQPNPWDLLQPQDAMSRHRGAKPPRRYGLLAEISLLSPEYLLSDRRRPFHLCALRAITNRTEGTFGLLRYPFGGYRPSKTAHLARSHGRITVAVRNL